MNRRNFIKSTALGLGAVTLAPTIALASNEVPLYKQFDWIAMPVATLYRINTHGEENYLECMPVTAKSSKLNIITHIDVDLTRETITKNLEAYDGKLKYNQTIYTNELLLNEAKRMGFTHIYMFGSYIIHHICEPYDKILPYRTYFVRGVKKPDWKTVDGKLQVVEVDNAGIPIKI